MEETKAKGITMGVYRDFIIQARTRSDGRPLSRKAAEEIRSVAQAQADIEAQAQARETPESQQGKIVNPFAEVVALHTQMETQDRAGCVPGLGFRARPTQLFPPSGSCGSQASSSGPS